MPLDSKVRLFLQPYLDPLRPFIRRFWQHPEFDEVGLVYTLLRPHGPSVMVDVGAHHGGTLRPFAVDGWRVIAVEPDPDNRQVLRRRFSRRPNVVIDERAISVSDGQRVALYTSPVSTGISALAPFHPSHRATGEVETVRLDTLLAEEQQVAFLKTDTEGWDLAVLRTFPWTRLHPLVVMCEFEDRKTVPLGYDYHELARYLTELQYVVFTSEWYPVVEYGQRHRWRSLQRYPAQLADPAAWGNLLAVHPDLAARTQLLASRMMRS